MICTAPDTFFQYPGPVFGAGAAGAVFRGIAPSHHNEYDQKQLT